MTEEMKEMFFEKLQDNLSFLNEINDRISVLDYEEAQQYYCVILLECSKILFGIKDYMEGVIKENE